MALTSLQDLYIDQLQDLHSANTQARGITRQLADAAADPGLRSALEAGVAGIENGLAEVRRILEQAGADPEGEHCEAMAGLAREAEAHALKMEITDPSVRDAMIITQYQRMVHYAIAAYGSVAAFAARLGRPDEAEALRRCLDACKHGDQTMNALAMGGINQAAT